MSDADPEFFTDDKTHKLILGSSFKNSSHTAFHTVRYDFKPASVDPQQEGKLEVGDASEVTVSLPHIQGSKTACTVYKGSKKPAQKECVLIFDHVTGEFTLERITSQIQVKKTRDSGNGNFSSHPSLGPTAPKLPKVLPGMSKKTGKPTTVNRSFNRKTELPQKRNDELSQKRNEDAAHVSIESLPKPVSAKSEVEKTDTQSAFSTDDDSHSSSSSSCSSSSDDESGSSSDENEPNPPPITKPPIASSQLHEDLELSESGSDSD